MRTVLYVSLLPDLLIETEMAPNIPYNTEDKCIIIGIINTANPD